MNKMMLEARLALKFLKARRQKRFLSVASSVAVLGLGFGMGALLIALSVVSGFQAEYKKAILSFNSHLIFTNVEESPKDEFSRKIEADLGADFSGSSPFLYREGMIIAGGVVKGIVLKGIDLDRYARLSRMKMTVSAPQAGGEGDNAVPGLVLGASLARELSVKDGDKVRLLFPQAEEDTQALKARTFRMIGTFESGMHEYDSGFVFMDLTAAQGFFGTKNQVSGWEVWLRDAEKAEGLAAELRAREAYPFTVMSWKELNENIFRALEMEKLIFGILMSVLVAVAGLNLMSTLLMFLIEKRSAIAILRTQGLSWKRLRKIFLLNGLLIGSAGIFLGLAFGGTVLLALKVWHPIALAPEIYFIRTVPVLWSWRNVLWVAACGFTVIFVTSEWTLRRMKKLNVVQALQ